MNDDIESSQKDRFCLNFKNEEVDRAKEEFRPTGFVIEGVYPFKSVDYSCVVYARSDDESSQKDRALLLALSALSENGVSIDFPSVSRMFAKAIIDAIFDVIASPEE